MNLFEKHSIIQSSYFTNFNKDEITTNLSGKPLFAVVLCGIFRTNNNPDTPQYRSFFTSIEESTRDEVLVKIVHCMFAICQMPTRMDHVPFSNSDVSNMLRRLEVLQDVVEDTRDNADKHNNTTNINNRNNNRNNSSRY